MRWRAAQEAGWKKIPVVVADLTPEQQREFIIKDNVSGGEWDWDILANDWDAIQLNDWGVDVPDMSEQKTIETQNTNPFNRHHILISYHPDLHSKVVEAISALESEAMVEIESAAN